MEFTNEYLIVPFNGHYKVFVEGKDIAEVDSIEEAMEEVKNRLNE